MRTVKKWTDESKLELQACFDCTDWSVFEAAASDLDDTDTVTSYIRFCEDVCADQDLPHFQQQQTLVYTQTQAAVSGQGGGLQ